jgi:hypothetical protein
MAYSKLPASTFPSWTSNGTNITVPIASLNSLTAAEADVTTGDAREIVYSFLETVHQAYVNAAAPDKPAKMVITRASTVNETTGAITRTYTVRFTLDPSPVTVAAE